ncbi:hypothetical protein [Paenibacillus fonticola]|uniref:hypothetical protein n=1 Tax=Paenibacillus fonticola TaxID=379896 RepID=UPI0003768C22|nr:hypothetical protein [Paenibacillus fonticola]
MNKSNQKERFQLMLVLAGITLILVAILVFATYALLSLDFIHLRISSIASAFAFMGLLILAVGVLSIIGSMLDGLRKHVFQNSFKLVSLVIQEMILVAIFGGMIYWIDQWIDGVEIGNLQTELLLALFLYGIITLLAKLGDQIKKQDDEARKKSPPLNRD